MTEIDATTAPAGAGDDVYAARIRRADRAHRILASARCRNRVKSPWLVNWDDSHVWFERETWVWGEPLALPTDDGDPEFADFAEAFAEAFNVAQKAYRYGPRTVEYLTAAVAPCTLERDGRDSNVVWVVEFFCGIKALRVELVDGRVPLAMLKWVREALPMYLRGMNDGLRSSRREAA